MEIASESESPGEDRGIERSRIAELLEKHAPADWRDLFQANALLDAIIEGEPIQMFVMSADIRSSTLLMKEAVRFERFASIMDKFVSAVRRGIGRSGGWFDKFTGDGFLAYWIVQSGSDDEYHEQFVQAAGNMTYTARTLVDLFQRRVLEDFRSNSRNFPATAGLSMGLDGGPGYLVEIAGELTVVGSPVVGAVRMVTAATAPGEILANVFLGERLSAESDGVYKDLGVTASREHRPLAADIDIRTQPVREKPQVKVIVRDETGCLRTWQYEPTVTQSVTRMSLSERSFQLVAQHQPRHLMDLKVGQDLGPTHLVRERTRAAERPSMCLEDRGSRCLICWAGRC